MDLPWIPVGRPWGPLGRSWNCFGLALDWVSPAVAEKGFGLFLPWACFAIVRPASVWLGVAVGCLWSASVVCIFALGLLWVGFAPATASTRVGSMLPRPVLDHAGLALGSSALPLG